MKRIHINYAYSSVSGLSLAIGDYDVDAPELQGQAQYLVDTGAATVIDSPDGESAAKKPEKRGK